MTLCKATRKGVIDIVTTTFYTVVNSINGKPGPVMLRLSGSPYHIEFDDRREVEQVIRALQNSLVLEPGQTYLP